MCSPRVLGWVNLLEKKGEAVSNVSKVTDKTRELSRAAVQKNKNIRNEVRDIVVNALMEHMLALG